MHVEPGSCYAFVGLPCTMVLETLNVTLATVYKYEAIHALTLDCSGDPRQQVCMISNDSENDMVVFNGRLH